MKYARNIQRLHERQITRSIMIETGKLPSVAGKQTRTESAKNNDTNNQSSGK